MKPSLYLLDSYAIIYRAYFAFLNRPLRNASGTNISAAFGFFRFLFALFDERNPGAFAAVFDAKGKTFRHHMYPEYKATREKAPEDLIAQVPVIEEILAALKVPLLRAEGWEADDLIATLATRCAKEDRECWIVSGDKDLLQLVGGPVQAIRPTANFGYQSYGTSEVSAEWGVSPAQILDYLALVGDASDNVPGVKGVGDKTAVKLITEYGSLDGIYAKLEGLKPESLRKKLETGREDAYLSHRLITLDKDAPIGIKDLEELALGGLDRAAAAPIFIREGMKSLATTAPGSGGGDLFGPGMESSDRSKSTKAKAEAPSPPSALAVPAGLPPELSGSGEYETVTTVAALCAWVDCCIAAKRFAFDCETDSLDELSAQVVGFSLACDPRKACYVPLVAPSDELVSLDAARKELGRLFSAPGVVVIGHNVKYDFHIMRRFGVAMACTLRDTMIEAFLLDAESGLYGLEALAERRLGHRGIEFDEVVPKGATFAMVPVDRATAYAAEDADLTLRLHLLQMKEIEEAALGDLYRDLEMPLVPILAAMEAEGIQVEARELRAYGVELDGKLASIQAEIYKLVGHEFNIASTKQLQEVLFIERKLATGKKTKTGFSTDTSVLEELAELDPVPALILKHRTLAKLKSTYVDSLAGLAEEGDGRVHTHYSQVVAATGRLSSRDPNLQNIPIREEEGRKIRAAFVSGKGKTLISADYAQIELVVLAHLSGDEGLLKAFREGVDVHRRTAALLFGALEAEVTSEQRRLAKTINFGVIYGMSAFRLANELKIPRAEAQKFIDAYFTTYAGVGEFINRKVEETEKTGYTTTIAGRRRPIQAINSRNKTEKQAAERVAVNTPIQGSAADIIKLAMIGVDRALKETGSKAKLLLQVHDELILEAPESEAAAVSALVKREMEAAARLSLPLRASVETARRWGDMH